MNNAQLDEYEKRTKLMTDIRCNLYNYMTLLYKCYNDYIFNYKYKYESISIVDRELLNNNEQRIYNELKDLNVIEFYPKYDYIFNNKYKYTAEYYHYINHYEAVVSALHITIYKIHYLYTFFRDRNIIDIIPKGTVIRLNIKDIKENKDTIKTEIDKDVNIKIVLDDEEFQYFIDTFYEKFLKSRLERPL